MTVSAIGAATSPADNLYSSNTQTMGKDDFLKLLVTQLQNQDPLNPTDSTEFVSQLAQFSSLEQLSSVNDNLKLVQLFDQSINNSQAVTFVGKTVKASGSMFELGDGETHEIQYQLAEDAAAVYLRIYNSVSAGTYSFSIQAKNKDGEAMATAAYIEETVDGVSYHDGSTYLLANGIEIPYSAIIEVTLPEAK